MASGNVGYTDTRSYSGSLLGDIAGGIKDRVGNSMEMARAERANAAKTLNVGGRNDGVTQKEFDKEYGKGHFFKRALGSNFGGDRVARTRGYFEKNPPDKRDPTGTRESRFSAGFDYASKEGLIKGSRPLQGPKAPEYLYSYDRRYADVLGDAAKFKDDTLDKEKMKAKSSMFGGTVGTTDTRGFGKKDKDAVPVEDKNLTENIAKSLSGVEIQMTRLEQKMQSGDGEDGFVASLVSKNSTAIVAGFTAIHAAMSSLLGAVQGQTEAIKDGAEKKAIAEEKSEDKANRREEESDAEVLNGGVGNASIEKRKKDDKDEQGLLGSLFDLVSARPYGLGGKTTKTRALTRLLRRKTRGVVNPKVMLLLGGLLAGGAAVGGIAHTVGKQQNPERSNTPSVGPTSSDDPSGGVGFNLGGQIPGATNSGDAFTATLGDTRFREDIIPRSPENARMSEEAKYYALKKFQKQQIEVKELALRKYGSGGGWKDLGEKLLDGIKGLFGGGGGGDDITTTTGGGGANTSEKQQDVAKLMYNELVNNQKMSPDAAKLMIAEIGRENSLNRSTILGTHDDGGKTAYGAVSWQGGREQMLMDNLEAAGHSPSVEGLKNSGDAGVKINAATMLQDIQQRGIDYGGEHQELADLLGKEDLNDGDKDRVRKLMKTRYFVYNKSIPLQRSRDWSETVDKMTLGSAPPTPSRVSSDPTGAIPTLFTQLAPVTSPLTTTPIIDTESILQNNRQFQTSTAFTLPMFNSPQPVATASANDGGDVEPLSFADLGSNGFYRPNQFGI
jgi:hypothetical protein